MFPPTNLLGPFVSLSVLMPNVSIGVVGQYFKQRALKYSVAEGE